MADEDDGALVGGGLSVAPLSDTGGLVKAAESEKAFLPRVIHFVAASGGAPGSAAGGDPGRDGPVPPRYLYPRERLRALFAPSELRQVGRGLSNSGNTCFFNSVLQTLTYTQPLQRYFLTGEHTASCAALKENTFCALCLFERHVQEVLAAGRSCVFPKPLLRRLKQLGGKSMQLGRQEDAHEFLLQFLDSCHKAALRPALQSDNVPPLVQRTTLIHQLFGGYLRSQVVCLECQHESNTFDPFLDLSLEVRTWGTLEQALKGFTKSERLSGPNRYKCKQCQRPVEVTKRFFIHTLPPLMMFQLKRFEFIQGTRGKIVKNVTFRTCIDLREFTSHPEREAKYRLYAVIVHQGHSAKSGHYYAYARHAAGQWYQFDDEKVRMVTEQEVLRQQAYLLFYEAADPPQGPDRDVVDVASTPAAAPIPADLGTAVGSSTPAPADPAATAGAGVGTATQAECKEEAMVESSVAGASRAEEQAERREEGEAAVDTTMVCASATSAGEPAERREEGEAAVDTTMVCASATSAGEPAPCESSPDANGLVTGLRLRSTPRLGRCSRRLRMLKRLRKSLGAAAEPVPAPPAPRPSKLEDVADLMEVSRTPNHSSQFGHADVSSWDGAPPNQAFQAVQQLLQPGPQRRDELDMAYDVGKLKHKPRKAKPTFAGKPIFDEETRRRLRMAANRHRDSRHGDGRVERGRRKRGPP